MTTITDRHKTVDSNEPWEIREKLLATGWAQSKLPAGDFSFFTIDFKRVGIERKTIEDLLASLSDRFTRQLDEIVNRYDFAILLIEGSWHRVMGTNQIVSRRGIERYYMTTVRNLLRSWQDRGLTIENTLSMEDTINRLGEIYAYYQKAAHTGGLTKRQVGDKRLLAFPDGVGIKTARRILKELGSLRAVAEASIDRLVQIENVGAKRAESIAAHFNREGEET